MRQEESGAEESVRSEDSIRHAEGDARLVGSTIGVTSLHRVRNALHLVAKLFDDVAPNASSATAEPAAHDGAFVRSRWSGAPFLAEGTLNQLHCHRRRYPTFFNILIWDNRD